MRDGPLLAVDDVSFRYRTATSDALQRVSLRVEPGEVVLVAGPSGCGKSTLIRAVNGLIPHAYRGDLRGSVRLEGRLTTELRLRDTALMVGTLLQDPAKQIVGSTVEAELAFGPENLGLARATIRERLAAALELTRIGDLAGRDTSTLSGGERQLVAMAATLMMEPRLLVVDEPLANLDPATADRLLAILRQLADSGAGVIIVEHRVEDALSLRPTQVLYLQDGRTAYQGSESGFLRMADPTAVKLPFEVILERARSAPETALEADLATHRGQPRPGSERLAFDDLAVDLGDRPVLHGISAAFGAREIVAVLGPNGSGKTTLFRSAMHLVAPRSGSVRVNGASAAGRTVAELARVFGYVFQSPSQMLFARTVREELLFGPRNLGLLGDDPDAAALVALRRTGLADLHAILSRPPLTLSFGQQKRLAVAIALAIQPPTLILDEPSAGQDHRSALAFMTAVAGIEGLESLYLITHDVDLALTHADRILVLRDGRVAADGPPRGVIEDLDRWSSCNLHTTSLMAANVAWRPGATDFVDAITLARWIVRRERTQAADRGVAESADQRG
jgi:energy-coupling factor transport system ATP-binding protein